MPARRKTSTSALSAPKTQGAKTLDKSIKRQHVNSAVMAEMALEAIIAGRKWEEARIAAGYASRGAAFNAVQNLLAKRTVPHIDTYRAIEEERLNCLWEIAYGEIAPEDPELVDELGLRADDADDGDEVAAQRRKHARPRRKVNLWAIDRCIAISAERRKLLGLDAKAGADLTLGGQVLIRRYDADVEAV